MAFAPFKKIRLTSDQDLTSKNINAMQDNIAQAFQQILGKDSLDEFVVKNLQLQPGLNKVAHMLGRKINGWTMTRPRNGYAFLYEDVDNNQSPNLLLYLHSVNQCTVDLKVF
jgi:hypothetical protein